MRRNCTFFTYSVRFHTKRVASPIALNIMLAFHNLTIKDELKRVEKKNPTFSFYISPAVDGSATDDQHVIDFNPDQ